MKRTLVPRSSPESIQASLRHTNWPSDLACSMSSSRNIGFPPEYLQRTALVPCTTGASNAWVQSWLTSCSLSGCRSNRSTSPSDHIEKTSAGGAGYGRHKNTTLAASAAASCARTATLLSSMWCASSTIRTAGAGCGWPAGFNAATTALRTDNGSLIWPGVKAVSKGAKAANGTEARVGPAKTLKGRTRCPNSWTTSLISAVLPIPASPKSRTPGPLASRRQSTTAAITLNRPTSASAARPPQSFRTSFDVAQGEAELGAFHDFQLAEDLVEVPLHRAY